MLVLDATTKSIKAVMASGATTTNPDFTAAFADNTGTVFAEGANDGAFNGTSPVTIVAAPSSSTRRVIKYITIENRDTAAVTVTLSYDNNGTLRTIANVTLQVGDTWTTNGTFDTNGNLKQIIGTVNLATQVTGTLPVANGGTGITSFGTGIATWLGTPSSANLASAVTDETGSGALVFGTAPSISRSLLNTTKEKLTISATAATGTINFDAITQSVLYYTSDASGNWTLNVRGDSGTTLDSIMSTGESITVAFLATQGGTAYYQSAFQVDGSGVTPKWQGGSAPTEGNASGIDAYVINIIKTGSATFTALASITQFA